MLLGFPSIRLTGDYLGITTLGFAEIVRIVFINLDITGGARGLAGIPRDTNLAIVLVLAALSIICMYSIHNSRFGRALTAIREDELAAEAMGINILFYKVKDFCNRYILRWYRRRTLRTPDTVPEPTPISAYPDHLSY